MNPIANFIFNIIGLTLLLTDKSTNAPTDWLWDFGDGNSSNLQNPTHVYGVSGDYSVTLIASNSSGASEIFSAKITIYPVGAFSIDAVIAEELSAIITLNTDYITTRKTYWRLYLQTLIDPFIPDTHLQDENYWPSLVNMLIANLVISDYLLKLAKDSLINLVTVAEDSTASSGNGNIKAMEMGPSKAEWYDSSDTLKKLFSGDGSTYFMINSQVCQLARRLKITLPQCPPLNSKVIVGFKVMPCTPSAITHLQNYLNKYPNG